MNWRTLTTAIACVFSITLFYLEATDFQAVLSQDERRWVENHLQNLSLEQKIGQLLIPATDPSTHLTPSEKFKRIKENITRHYVGGYHIFRGQADLLTRLIQRMQNLASIPLFITADMEGGAGLIFVGGTRFPKAMAIGATFDESNAYKVGEITAKEAKKIGVNVNFYPVVDVNNNPRNPIINIRSFGEDPKHVSRMAISYIRGLQNNRLLATAKHFPGHGNTSKDSHLELPVVDVSLEQLKKVELVPFQAAIEAGVGAIMSAHLYLPSLEKERGLPATLSRRILTQLLRTEMSFKGLIFTDAMTMRGITSHYSEGEAALRALQAGADIILHPNHNNLKHVIEVLVNAVHVGQLDQDQLDNAVRRVLEVKARLSLQKRLNSNVFEINDEVGTEEHKEISKRIMESAVTLVRDRKEILPLSLQSNSTLLLLTMMDSHRNNDSRGTTLTHEFRKRHPKTKHLRVFPDVSHKEIVRIKKLLQTVNYVVVGAYIRVAAYKGSIGFSKRQLLFLKTLSELDKPFVLVLFGSPYLLSFVPNLPTYVLTYEDYSGAEHAVTKAIFGEIPFNGKLPISLPEFYPVGHAIQK